MSQSFMEGDKMENLLDAVKALKGKRQESGQPSLESLKVEALYTRYFEGKLEELISKYFRGTRKHIEKSHPELSRGLLAAENRVNDLWVRGVNGEPTIDDFRKAVNEWFIHHLEAIAKFSFEKNSEI